jgi:serine/threonine protein kinase
VKSTEKNPWLKGKLSTMDPVRWQKINQAFIETSRLDPDLRSGLLEKLCGSDPSLMQEVSSLVAAHRNAGEFMQKPVFEAGQLLDDIARRRMEGRRIGAYRLVREVGHGGMGSVYLAVRDDHQYQKLVAVKIIRTGLDTPLNVRHFYKERQILANLEHPNIARLLDGGATGDGLPYLVMEYVDGRPIDAYCDAQRLSVLERLQLFLKVCSAVQYAHEEGVIHRDIKPGNILVTPKGEAKLVDFGIAKLSAHRPVAPALTTTNVPRMTPEYASPEVVRGEAVTTSTDIYSLGIVLYELLSGRRSYRLRNWNREEIFRAVCQAAPERPSDAVLLTDPADPGAPTPERIARLRGERPDGLRRCLAGDLDNIVLKAIRKEPHRRYPSVGEFSQDIHRHLSGLPVQARGDSLAYCAGKFVQRNRLPVSAAALLALSFLAGFLTMQQQARRAQIQSIQSEKQAAAAKLEILGTRERARKAELEATHLRQESEEQKKQNQLLLLSRLNQILEAHESSRGLVINTSGVIFNAGRVNLGPDARERLAKIAGVLLECRNLKVQIEAHTDGYGDDAYNQALSEERARAVQEYLVNQGIPRKTISARGFGATRPVAPNTTETGRQKNRRVEMIVSGDLIRKVISVSAQAKEPGLRTASWSTASRTVTGQAVAAGSTNLALNRPATGSTPCNAHEGPEKAFNGSVSGGNLDKWCSEVIPAFLQVDLGSSVTVAGFVVRHASAGGESADFNTRDFDIQISANGADFITVARMVGNREGVTTHPIRPAAARFVRLNITAPAQLPETKLSRIYELEIYSSPLSASAPAPSLSRNTVP